MGCKYIFNCFIILYNFRNLVDKFNNISEWHQAFKILLFQKERKKITRTLNSLLEIFILLVNQARGLPAKNALNNASDLLGDEKGAMWDPPLIVVKVRMSP